MSLSTGIASTPAQKVSLDDLTALGLDRLQAMASGQQSSIAPSYLVIAAIEALKKGKAGVQQPQPQGTIKDQLLASLQPKPMPTPPQAMGIGAMARPMPPRMPPQGPPQMPQQPPVQGMAGGGKIRKLDYDSLVPIGAAEDAPEWYDIPPEPIGLTQKVDPQTAEDRALVKRLMREGGSGIMDALTMGPRVAGKIANQVIVRPINALGGDVPRFPVSDSFTPYSDATKPTARVGTEKGRGTNTSLAASAVIPARVADAYRPEGANVPRPNADRQIGERISASASQRGIGPFDSKLGVASGEIKPEKFERMTDSPVNQALIDAAEKFGKPDEARMKELRAAEENAGLAAFGAGMIKPGGSFGGVFAGAARDYVNTKEAKAEKRREYEDNRELTAMKLKIAVGDEKAKKFWAETEYNDKRSDKAFERASKVTETGNSAVHINNQATLELAKLKLMQEKNALEAAMLKEGKSQANQAKLEKVYLMAHEIAIKDAESIYGKTEDTSGVLNPTKAADKQRHIENKTAQMLGDLTKYFGLPGAGSASPSTSPLRANYAK